jgi:hypothetical protein
MIKHNDVSIDKDNPFLNCKLAREKYANILTDIVKNYKDGFVLAINSEWGTGKTTFVKMWQQQLQNSNLQTLYFNAWENDFEENPLIALIAEFKELYGKNSNVKFKSVIEKATTLFKNIAPALAKTVAESNTATKAIADLAENLTKGATEILEDELKEYNKKKQGIIHFKKALKDFVDAIEGEKPIVFIIDELDRCRPSYAVLLLEQIKHLFCVPNIVFVLAIDKEQLGHAVRGVYGSEKLNAEEYLRRFIDLEYSLPRPDTKTYLTYLYHYFKFNEMLLGEKRKNIREFWDEPDAFVDISAILFEKGKLSLRQQERIFAHARIALRSLRFNQYLFPTLFTYLIYLKQYHYGIYTSIQAKNYNTQDLLQKVIPTIPLGADSNSISYIIHLEALLAYSYNNYKYERDGKHHLIVENKSTGEKSVKIKSHFDESENQKEFANMIIRCYERDSRDFSIKHLLDKIDLLERVEV